MASLEDRPVLYVGNSFGDGIKANLAWAVENSSAGIGPELELRLGVPGIFKRYGKGRNFSPSWSFDSNIGKDIFYGILSRVEKTGKFSDKVETKTTVSSVQYGKFSRLRKIEVYDEKKRGPGNIYYEDKGSVEGKFNADFLFSTSEENKGPESSFYIRCALSKEYREPKNSRLEEEYNRLVRSSPPNIRHRDRKSFIFSIEGTPSYSIDFTIVNNGEEYSVELEFTNTFLTVSKSKPDGGFGVMKRAIKELILFLNPQCENAYNIEDAAFSYYNLEILSMNGRDNLREVRPCNISKAEVDQLYNGYSFTNKLNGIKYRMFIAPIYTGGKRKNIAFYGLFCANDKDLKLFSRLPNPVTSVLADVEYFHHNGKTDLHIFDCLCYNDNSVTDLGHMERVEYARKFVEKYNLTRNRENKDEGSIKVKDFFYSGNPIVDLKQCISLMFDRYGEFSIEDTNDGVIMTPLGISYWDNSKPIYKWKFPSTVSIDFRIKRIDNFIEDSIDHKVYELYCADKGGESLFGFFKIDKNKTCVRRKRDSDVIMVKYDPPSVYISSEKTDHFYSSLSDGMIVEFSFNRENRVFYPIKIRYDKTRPNFKDVAQATFVDMDEPFSLPLLTSLLQRVAPVEEREMKEVKGENEEGKEAAKSDKYGDARGEKVLEMYRKFHNRVKAFIIQKWTEIMKHSRKESEMNELPQVLDLGAGRGGDLGKYKGKISHLWVVEPNEKFIEDENGLISRIKSYGMEESVSVIKSKAQDTDYILSKLGNNKVDIVSSFFSMSFFFESIEILRSFTRTVNKTSKKGGKFIGVMMDGVETEKLLDQYKGTIETRDFAIKKKYKDSDPPMSRKISIKLNTPTVEGEQIEWLGEYSILRDMLESLGYRQIESYMLNDDNFISQNPELKKRYRELPDNEKLLNSLYRYFCFEYVGDDEYVGDENKDEVDNIEERVKELERENEREREKGRILIEEQRREEKEKERERIRIEEMRREEEREKMIEEAREKEREKEREKVRVREREREREKEKEENTVESLDIDENDDFEVYGYEGIVGRTGVIGDGSCFFHSLLYALMGDKYKNKSEKQREKVIQKLRKFLADSIDLKLFSSLAFGDIEYLGIRKYLIKEFRSYQEIKDILKENNLKMSDIVDSAISTGNLQSAFGVIKSTFESMGFEEDEINILINNSRLAQLEAYKEKIRDTTEWMTSRHIELIARLLKKWNIFIISDNTRMLMNVMNESFYKPENANVVILNVNESHFEPLFTANISDDGESFSSKYIFSWDDEFIIYLRSMMK